jgi:hypothetical protein
MERIVTQSETDWGALESLVEEIRITTLNLAITATRFSGGGDAGASVRRSTSDLVNLCLDTVNRLTGVLKSAAVVSEGNPTVSDKYLQELEKIESDVRMKSRKIIDLLRGIERENKA